MRVRMAVWLAAVLLAAAPWTAEARPDRPVFPPTRDVAVTYRVSASQPGLREVVVRYSAAADRLRVEGTLPGYLLVERRTRQATVVMEPLGIMTDAPRRAEVERAFALESGRGFTRRGSATVAGLRCTVWDIAAESGTGSACVTADGVVLRASGRDRRGREGAAEATRVEYSPQPEALFFPPPGLRKVDLPAGAAPGRAMGGGAGLGALLERLRGQQ